MWLHLVLSARRPPSVIHSGGSTIFNGRGQSSAESTTIDGAWGVGALSVEICLNSVPWNGIFWCILMRYHKLTRHAIVRSKTRLQTYIIHLQEAASSISQFDQLLFHMVQRWWMWDVVFPYVYRNWHSAHVSAVPEEAEVHFLQCSQVMSVAEGTHNTALLDTRSC